MPWVGSLESDPRRCVYRGPLLHQFLPFIAIGLATGAVYGLAGLGLVLTYKTSGVFNFGYGALAALVAFLFYVLYVDLRMPWGLAAAISLFVFAPLVGLLMELLARSLGAASEPIKVVATIGIILVVEAISTLWHPSNSPTFPNFLPQSTVRLLGANVTWAQIILFLLSLGASSLLWWFFRSARLGILMRGVVDNGDLVAMSGDDPIRVRRWSWVIGTVFAGVAGLLLAPTQPLDGVTIATIVFAAFGAAAIGYFTNLPLTFAGGLLIGLGGAFADKYSATISWIGGIPASLPFIVLFVVLIFMPRGRLVQRRIVAQLRVRKPYYSPTPIRLSAGVVAVALLAVVPVIQATQVDVWSAGLIDVGLFLSLGLLVRRSGQISLCQLSFAAVGAAAFGHFAGQDHIPWLLALVLASLVAVPVGAFIAISAVRVSGVFLALATLGFSILTVEVFYTRSFMFGSSQLGLPEPRPDVSIGGWNLSTDTGFYYLLLIITVVLVAAVVSINNGRLGRLLEALSDSPLALETQGASSSVMKVLIFCITAAMASMSGALTAMLYHFGVGTYFPWFSSIYFVAIVIVLTLGDPWYGIIGALAYAVIPGYVHGQTISTVLQLLFGLGAVTAAFSTRSGGTPEAVQKFLERFRRTLPASTTAPVAVSGPRLAVDAGKRANGASVTKKGLEVRELSVRFGGVKAVSGVSLCAPMGRITGLVGPNGAGKTTIFNACSGLNQPSAGRVLLHGVDVSGEGAGRRARRGLGRTFQRTELFNSLTVRQNVAMGREAAIAGANPLAQISGSRRSSRLLAEVTGQALAVTGTSRIADAQVGLLPIGQRRLVELARTLAGPFDMLLLDEPSSGLDGHETDEFGRVLQTVVAERGCGILLVEHDMTLVRGICDRVYVLDFGTLIFEGTPDEMHESDTVRAAYLGDTAPRSVTVPEDLPASEAER